MEDKNANSRPVGRLFNTREASYGYASPLNQRSGRAITAAQGALEDDRAVANVFLDQMDALVDVAEAAVALDRKIDRPVRQAAQQRVELLLKLAQAQRQHRHRRAGVAMACCRVEHLLSAVDQIGRLPVDDRLEHFDVALVPEYQLRQNAVRRMPTIGENWAGGRE